MRRKDAEDVALAAHDFGPDDRVVEAGRWERDGDESTCLLSMDGPFGTYRMGFIVRFGPDGEVREAYPGDPH